jgi:DNA repair protein RadC
LHLGPKPNRSVAEPKNQGRIRSLQAEQQALLAEKCMREKEAQMLLQYSETLSSQHVAPDKAIDYMSSFVQRSKQNAAAVVELDNQTQSIQEQIQEEKGKISERKGGTQVRTTMVLSADSDTSAHLKLTYSGF